MVIKVCISTALCVGCIVGRAQHTLAPVVSLLAEEMMVAGHYGLHSSTNITANSLPSAIFAHANDVLKEDVLDLVKRWQRVTNQKVDEYSGWYANGQQAIVVHLRKSSLHGQWQTWYENGQIRDAGMFVHNQPHGVWRSWYTNGRLRCERHLDAHKMQQVELAARQRNPKLAFNFISREAIQHPEKLKYYLNPNTGLEKLNKLADEYQFPFDKGLQHGFFANYYDNGILQQSGYYKEGLKDGLWLLYSQNGKLSTAGYYQLGQLHGPSKEYNSLGTLQKLSDFNHGKKIFEKNYTSGL